MPDLGVIPLSAITCITCRLRSYVAALRTKGVMRLTVSILCEIMSGRVSVMSRISSVRPWKSGISVSRVVLGFIFLIHRIVSAQCEAPKSGKSSLSTEVITAWSNFIKRIDSATCRGSSGSSGSGFPLCVLQNLHERVQIAPPIIKVAVPFPQHSPKFGHRPLEQMVWSLCVSTMRLVSA